MGRVPLRRVLRLTGLVLTALGLLVVLAAVVVVLVAQGPRFGWLATKLLPATAGQIVIGGGRMTFSAWGALLTGRPAPIQLTDVKVTDPEGTLVLAADLIATDVEVHLGPTRVILHNLRVTGGFWRLGQMKTRRTLGFFAAFASPKPARPGRRPPAPAGFRFQIAEARLQRLETVFDFSSWGLTLKGVETTGSLLLEGRGATSPLFTFDVAGVDAREGGVLRVLRETRAIRLPFEHAEIERVGITPEHPNEILLIVTGARTGRSRLHGRATFSSGSSAAPRKGQGQAQGDVRPGMDLTASLDTPADALTAVARHSDAPAWQPLRVEGAAGAIAMLLKGPYDALRGALSVEGLDVIYQERIFRRVRLKVDLSLRPLHVSLHDFAFGTPGAGRVNLNAELDSALEFDGDLRLHHVATDSYLPSALRPLAGGSVTGRVSAHAGLRSGAAILRTLDLTLTRPARSGSGLPPVIRVRGGAASSRASDPLAVTLNIPALSFSDGTLTIRKLSGPFPLLGGQLTLDGRIAVWDKTPSHLYPSPKVALAITGADIDLGRAGLRTLIDGRVSFRADLSGSLDHLGVRLTLPPTSPLLILGDRYTANGPIDLRLAQGELFIPSLHLDQSRDGRPGRINIHGEVGLRGRAALDLSINDHRLSVLPGLGGGGLPVRGLVDAELHLRGPPAKLELGGAIQLKRVVLRGTSLGDGWLKFTPSGHRRVTVAGLLFEHFRIDGSIVDEPSGPSILLGIDLQNAPLDPLLPSFPVLGAGRGVASGRVTMKLAPGAPAAFDGSFTELALSYAVLGPRGTAATARPRIAVRNSGPLAAHMDGWGDALVVSQASVDLGSGPVRIAGRLDHGLLDVSVAGQLALDPLQPLVGVLTGDAVQTLTGMIRADLKLVGPLSSPILQGQAAIVRPVEIVTRQPLEARLRITGGALALAGNTLRLDAFTARLTTKLTKPQALFDGTVRTDGRMTLLPGKPPILSGRAQLTDVSLTLPSMSQTIRIPGATLVGDGREITVASLQATVGGGSLVIGDAGGKPAKIAIASLQPFAIGAVDVPLAGRRINWSAVGGLDVDELDFDLRLGGDARRTLTLSGDVRLVAGRYSADVAAPPAAKPSPARPSAKPPAARRPSLLDRVFLDLRLRTVGDRFVIKKKHFPALHLDLELHARGQASDPHIEAEAKATDLYGMLALLLYRLVR